MEISKNRNGRTKGKPHGAQHAGPVRSIGEVRTCSGIVPKDNQDAVFEPFMMLILSNNITIPMAEIEIQAVRSQGSGGQNVNKVSTAVHLRFAIKASSLPELYKERLLNLKDNRISSEGIVIIKAQRYRSQIKNKEDALSRLQELIDSVIVEIKPRKPSRPTKSSRIKRMEEKTLHSRKKSLRGKIEEAQ